MSPILGIWASSKFTQADSGAMFPLQVITVGATAVTNVTFTNIPSTYKHLQIRAIGRTDRAATGDYLNIQFNGVTTTTYALHELLGDGSSASAGANSSVSATNTQRFAGANASASVFGAFVLDILDYADTNKNKTIRGLGGTDNNGSGIVALTSGLWASTNAITSIKFYPGIGTNFVQYSQFALYGVKGA
jgi:hypothetical protein